MRFPADALAEHWGLTGADVRPQHGAMNSATWFVTEGGQRFVAKAAGGWFPGVVAVADALAGRGFAGGAPVRTTDGQLLSQDEWGYPRSTDGSTEPEVPATLLPHARRAVRHCPQLALHLRW